MLVVLVIIGIIAYMLSQKKSMDSALGNENNTTGEQVAAVQNIPPTGNIDDAIRAIESDATGDQIGIIDDASLANDQTLNDFSGSLDPSQL